MINIVVKKIKGKEYLYLVASLRRGEKVVQKTIKYIGKKRPMRREEFECMKKSYQMEDWILNAFADELSYQDHEAMKKASRQYQKYFQTLDKMSQEKEKEKFLSIFISNSNAIEGSTLTVKDTYDYLFNDITPGGRTKKELHMAANLLEAWNYVEANFKRYPLNKDLLMLHQIVNNGIETKETLGRYKKVQNYIGDVYTTSFLFVPERMKKLLHWIKKAKKEVNEFEIAFQSHAQFEVIHPFVDGNGRVGRLILNWLLLKEGLRPLAISFKKRDKYISALENSRRGKIEAICRFCRDEYLRQYQFV